MTNYMWIQLILFVGLLLALVKPLGHYMAGVYRGEFRWAAPVEDWLYRVAGVNPQTQMTWRGYAAAVLTLNFLGFAALYGILQWQEILPVNPQQFSALTPDLAFNTAISFVSNTNWQSYGGETTLSHGSQMWGLTVQNFLSAATGMAVLIALVRGFTGKLANTIGNFWVDFTRSILYILLPLSVIWAILLIAQGVPQTLAGSATAQLIQPLTDANGATVTEQTIALGPVASQVAIKQLGTNGGGFFNVNSAHPLENPTPISNFLQLLAILLIPAALCYTFGDLVDDTRQGWAILAAMTIIFVPLCVGTMAAEQLGVPAYEKMGIDQSASEFQSGGNMEGKETRFGIASSALWATATTAASNGSVNAMHDSFTPLGGLIPMWLMQLGEVIYGGVGSGLYGMLVFAIIAVFVAGLMVGRTPEYLGKKIEAAEMKLASLVILIPPFLVLIGTAISVAGPGLDYIGATPEEIKSNLNNPGAHGFSEVLYAWSSAGNNNGSAFAGLTANEPFYNTGLGIAMFLARFALIVPVLAIAGSLARKKVTPASTGTLPTHTPLFVALLIGVVLLVGALTFVPALALGPVVEHLQFLG
ncbi:MAG: potassium-transporting ATPase subunit KdpA [Pirellulales bacterium]|nr:potassium-transporting ATPase subunit KdpA [Pirellulales bacterium]